MDNINNSFQCYKCGTCCENLFSNSIIVFPSDIDRICKAMKIKKRSSLQSIVLERIFYMKIVL